MKEYQIDAEKCSADQMASSGLMILTTVIRERTLEGATTQYLKPEAQAEQAGLELTEKLAILDKRLKRGLQLLVDKLPKALE